MVRIEQCPDRFVENESFDSHFGVPAEGKLIHAILTSCLASQISLSAVLSGDTEIGGDSVCLPPETRQWERGDPARAPGDL